MPSAAARKTQGARAHPPIPLAVFHHLRADASYVKAKGRPWFHSEITNPGGTATRTHFLWYTPVCMIPLCTCGQAAPLVLASSLWVSLCECWRCGSQKKGRRQSPTSRFLGFLGHWIATGVASVRKGELCLNLLTASRRPHRPWPHAPRTCTSHQRPPA